MSTRPRKTDGSKALDIFGHIPGIGPAMAGDLWDLGMRSITDLAEGDPEAMYTETRRQAGGKMDRCVLYVYRCAVAFAKNPNLETELRQWWMWKD